LTALGFCLFQVLVADGSFSFQNFCVSPLSPAPQAVKTLTAEGDLVAQIMRAAAVAFGGGRKGDYPKAAWRN